MPASEELVKEAEELGIDVDGRWSDSRLQDEIDKKLAEPADSVDQEPKPKTEPKPKAEAKHYRKVMKGTLCISLFEVPDQFSPSSEQLKDDLFMRKLKHAVKCGYIEVM